MATALEPDRDLSWIQLVKRAPAEVRARLVASLDPAELEAITSRWEFLRRPSQTPPDWAWQTWALVTGRGFGKTLTGANWIVGGVAAGELTHPAIVGRSAAAVRDVMVEGESGLIVAARMHGVDAVYYPSKRRVDFGDGVYVTCYSADKPDQLRGPNHDGGWADEVAAWQRPEAFDMLKMTLRIKGSLGRLVVTTTPRPTAVIKELLADSMTAVTRGSTYQNADNLSDAFLAEMRRKYEGTRLGRQELYAEVLDDVEGALWTRSIIDDGRVQVGQIPQMRRIVVGVDPPATEEGAKCGIVVCGYGTDGEFYVLADWSMNGRPDEWGRKVVDAVEHFSADRVIAERNQGGDMVSHTMRTIDRHLPIRTVHAKIGKIARAEPVAAVAEQRRLHHVGMFAELEDEMCEWSPQEGPSPDRLDAMVYAVTELLSGARRDIKGPIGVEKTSNWRL